MINTVPLTTHKGIVLPGLYNFDGPVGRLPIRKERVREIFGIPWHWDFEKHPWFSKIPRIGLNAYTFKRRGKMSGCYWYPYRNKVIKMLRPHFDFRIETINDEAVTTGTWPLGDQNWQVPPRENEVMLITVYSLIDGGYVGNPEKALNLYRQGIKPQKRHADSRGCTIGFCEREQKWYGWGRAMYGFGIGSRVQKGSVGFQPSTPDEIVEGLKSWHDYHEGDLDCVVDGESLVVSGVLERKAGVTDRIRGEVRFENERFSIGRGEWVAETLEDAKQMAIDFAAGC